ncbi:uncharacterized protein LOC143910952 isoform X2 [Arctopsyche grandis]|uniref:uncharacterized protein LOC143910952 isoform X2 n=1 Tax=Arctopsyche grandis TaxID=121162 RepID=UPI00406D700F
MERYFDDGAMSLDETRQSQRPYRYGMVLLCIGALINWLGLAEHYAEPVRYIGVACIIAGALLICAAMCCWLQAPMTRPQQQNQQIDDPIHVITVPDEEVMQQKPPDYDSVAGAPPTYDDAIKLDPSYLLPSVHLPSHSNHRIGERSPSRSISRNLRNDQTLSNAAINTLLRSSSNVGRESIPGQLEGVITEIPSNTIQIPQTPPPPYRPSRTIR